MFSIKSCKFTSVVSIILFAFLLLFSGCGGQDADSKFQKAQEYLSNGKQAEAIIELKNALKANKQHLASRQLLAELYYQAGSFSSAEKEARRALEIEQNVDSEVVLDKTLLVMGRSDEVETRLKALEPIEADSQPRLAVIKARMLLDRGEAEQAGEILKNIETDTQSTSGDSDIFVALARYYVLTQNIPGAKKVSLRATEKFPQRRKPWLTLGRIAVQEGDYQQALQYFEKAEAVSATGEDIPLLLDAIYGKSIARVRLGQNDQAIAELDQYLARFEGVPQLLYLKGLAQFQNRALKESRDTLATVIRNQANFSPALLLLGTVEYQLGSLEQARQHLRTYLIQQPQDPVGKRLLGELELRLNNPEKAFEVLKPLSEDGATTDSSLLALAGESALQSGSKELGVAYYKKAAELNPDNRTASTQYALALLRVGKTDQAVTMLNSLEPSTAAPFTREALLIRAYAQQKNIAKIEQLLADMEMRLAGDAAAQKFVGDVNLGRRDLDAAEGFYQKSLAIDDSYVGAVLGLAQVSQMRGDNEQAYELSEKAYRMEPNNEQIAVYHARLIDRVEGYQPAIAFLKNYVVAHENASTSIGMLVQLALENKDKAEISSLIDYLEKEKIDEERMLNLAIRLALDIDEVERADQLFAQLQSSYSNEITFLNTAANVHMKAGRLELAREQVQRLLALDPDHAQGLILAASLEATKGNFNKAVDYLADVPVQDQNQTRYLLLSGQVMEALKKYPDAARDYLQGLRESGGMVFLTNLYRVARAAPETEYEQMADDWAAANQVENNRRQIESIQALHYTAKKDYRRAAALYEQLLAGKEASQADASIMNNYAWNLYYAGDYEKSLKVANDAYRVSNENPFIGDTLGWILVNQAEQLEKGISLLRESYQASGKHPEIGYHLAYALDKNGETDAALDVLNSVLNSNSTFDALNDARQLLNVLENQQK